MHRRNPPGPVLLALCAAALCAGACRATPVALLDEEATPPYSGWLRRAACCAHASELVEAQAAGEEPLRIRVRSIRCGPPADTRLLVLLPGILADGDTWRFLAPLLAQRNDVLVLDPPGTGGSDGPDPATHPAPAWTPGWTGRLALRAAARWQARQGEARHMVLVGHSMGSAAWARALSEAPLDAELRAAADRIDGLVLLALPDVLLEAPSPTLEAIATTSDLEVRAGALLGVLHERTRDAVCDGVVAPERRAMAQEAARLEGMLAGDRTRHAAQAMLRRWRPLDAQGRPLWDAARALAERERGLAWPVLLVWGAQDDTLPFAMAARVASRLPRVERFDVPDARHSPHQERADLCAWRIARFLSEH